MLNGFLPWDGVLGRAPVNERRGRQSHWPLRFVGCCEGFGRQQPTPPLSDSDKRCALFVVHPVNDRINAGMID